VDWGKDEHNSERVRVEGEWKLSWSGTYGRAGKGSEPAVEHKRE